jgi:RNA polymerase sigma-70 factor (ECF subfamily)
MAPERAVERGASSRKREARFRALFDQEFDYVWVTLERLGVYDRDLEDVAQDVFVHVHRRLDEYNPRRPIRPWLFVFSLRCASDWRKSASHRVEVLGARSETRTTALAADEELARAQDVDLVLRALESVEIEKRAVFILNEFDECPMKEIAESLGIPVQTGYSRLHAARDEFTTAVRRLRAQRGGT